MKIKCEQCGGVLSIEPSDILAICPYCGSHLLISQGKTFSHKILRESISNREAKRRIYNIFISKFGKSVNIEISSSFIPFAEISGESSFLECLAPSFCEMFFVPYNLNIPAGEYRFLDEADFEINQVIFPEVNINSFKAEYGKEDVKGILYVPFFLINCEIGGKELSFCMDGYAGNLFCPFLESVVIVDERKEHLKMFFSHFFAPLFLVFPFYFIFKDNFFDFMGGVAFFYALYLFYLEEKRDE